MSAYERLARAVNSGGPTMHLRDDLIDLIREYDHLLSACDELEGTLAAVSAVADLTEKGHAAVAKVRDNARAAIAAAKGTR